MSECWCFQCGVTERESELPGHFLNSMPRVMHTCPNCGNKRCPRATNHDLECSGSNDPGQDGSRYA